MTYYRTCPICGAALDPSEICEDCRDTNREGTASEQRERAAANATNIDDGKADQKVTKTN